MELRDERWEFCDRHHAPYERVEGGCPSCFLDKCLRAANLIWVFAVGVVVGLLWAGK